jgi:Asp-tRNA(Asn)/Glu-tRNA(Gln) amidotransferase A subunit family amidase
MLKGAARVFTTEGTSSMSISGDDLLELSAGQAGAAMRAGTLKATTYAEQLLARVEMCHELRALTAIDSDAVLRAAWDADAQRAAGGTLGSFTAFRLW